MRCMQALAGQGITIQHALADIGDADAVARAIGQFGPIDILINNAGFSEHPTFAKTDPRDWAHDINGNLNALGDGINVAQRVMSFAAPNQVLVSQSYFEVVSRLSDDYKPLFRYDSVRKDKHVREHVVYELTPSNSGASAAATSTLSEESGELHSCTAHAERRNYILYRRCRSDVDAADRDHFDKHIGLFKRATNASHEVLERYFRERGSAAMTEGMPRVPLGSPVQLMAAPGDVVLCLCWFSVKWTLGVPR